MAGPPRPRVRDEMREVRIISDGAMLVRSGLIERVGTRAEVEPLITAEHTVVDARGKAILPGFVDAHTHPVFGGNRVDEFEKRATGVSYEQIASEGGGIRSTVRKTRAASEDELLSTATARAHRFLRHGTTTIEAKSGYGLSLETELKMLRVMRRLQQSEPLKLVPTFLGAHEIPDEFRSDPQAYMDLIVNEMLPAVAAQRLADYCDVFCEPKIFSVASARQVLEKARTLGLGLRMHADQLSRSGASELAGELRTQTADHLEQIDERGIDALVRGGVQPVVLPASVYTLGSKKFAPAREMISRGLPLVLATDFNPGSSPTQSIPLVLSLASTQMGLSCAEALTAVTINAAYSLSIGDLIGSLEPGKIADFVLLDCEDYREIAYYVGTESVSSVYAKGKLVYQRN